MVKRIGGLRRKTRSLMKKPIRAKGKLNLSKVLASFEQGDKVLIKPEPSVQKGMAHKRYAGKIGVVKGKQGNCYKVELKDENKLKTLLVSSVHLRRM